MLAGHATMRAMVLSNPGERLQWAEWAIPKPTLGEVLVKVAACAVCRTDLHVFDGEIPGAKSPLILGHEIVGTVMALGEGVGNAPGGIGVGDRVGIPWLGWACGECRYCRSDRENLCDQARFTGHTIDGGYAEYTVADARFCFRIPDSYGDAEAAPLLCAGLIGHRALIRAGSAHRLGLYGFGAAAHIVAQVARHQGRELYGFTRPGDLKGQEFARSLGAVWAGDSTRLPPESLDAAILFAPIGTLVPQALRAVAKGGTVVCAGIHMSDIPSFPYGILWGERELCSVANLTRRDGRQFLALAPQVPVRTLIETFPLSQANEALERLRVGRLQGVAVLVPDYSDSVQPTPTSGHSRHRLSGGRD